MGMRYTPSAAEKDHVHSLLAQRLAHLSPEYRTSKQVLGRRSTIGCVALEITQRCNLDCTLCYLSEYSESIPDIPIETIKRRLDLIKEQYGVRCNVQITGGDPTMRDRKELVEIIRYAASIGLYPALFTNGIRASRDLLKELADVGLIDVAIHVDLTQERKGFKTEMELCSVREKYIERAQGLGLSLIFNTTVFDGNVDEVPALARWFRDRAGTIGMASFQMQASTGRGFLRERGGEITKQKITELIDEGVGAKLSWDSVLIGHPDCHNIAYTLSTEGKTVDLFDLPGLAESFLAEFGNVEMDRTQPVESTINLMRHVFTHSPHWVPKTAPWLGKKLLQFGPAFARARLRRRPAGKISFFIQNFQDENKLVDARIHNCSFHVATDQGGISMCLHNAKRDEFIIPAWMKKGFDLQPKRPPIGEVDRATSADAQGR
jgi:7,8-dihydro-6-hydroxymethylpterin dimethyltransferase